MLISCALQAACSVRFCSTKWGLSLVRYEDAFGRVLDMADVGRVTWLCQQVDPAQLLGQDPLPLSQSVLLSLMQQLGTDLSKVPSLRFSP